MNGFPGKGLLEGLAVTAKNFIGSYFDGNRKERLFTYQYPEERMPLPENSRTFPFLVYDGTPDQLRCTACKVCETECPPQCIYIVRDSDPNGKPLQRPKVFDIDISVCMQCGICAEVCPFDAIKMDCDFERSQHGRFEELVAHLPSLLKSNDYYHHIKPTEADRVDATRKRVKKPSPAAAAPAPAPGPAVAAVPAPTPLKPMSPPADILTEDEKRAWLKGYQSILGTGPIIWPPTTKKTATTPQPPTPAPAAATVAAPPASSLAGGEPWHDSGLDLAKRMELAKDRPLADRLMAAMAQLDCQACGYDCRGYANALAAGVTRDVTLCAPGEDETKNMLETLLKEAGKL